MRQLIFTSKKQLYFLIVLISLLFGLGSAEAATITSTATGGNWNVAGTWVGGVVPANGDTVVIATTGANSVVLVANISCAGITINTGATLNVLTRTVTINGAVINNGTVTGSTGRLDQGASSTSNFTNAGSITFTGRGRITLTASLINTGTMSLANSIVRFVGSNSAASTCSGFSTTGNVNWRRTAGSVTMTGNITSGNLLINGTGGTLNLGTGLTHTITGTWTRTNGTLNGGSSLLRIGGNVAGSGGGTFTAGTGTVEYYGGAQTAAVVTYNNLTVTGTLAKTFTTTPTVNGILSMEGTTAAVVVTTGVVTYGSNATLQYNKSAAYTTTLEEFLATFSGTGGVIIKGTGVITLDAAKTLNCGVPLNINAGGTLTTNNNVLTLGGNFIQSGTFNAGSSNITINCNGTQNISGFSTTGLVSMTKTGGIATLTGNVNAGALTINGTGGGTLNLGTSLTHTFTGNITLTAGSGSLNGGSSLLNANSATASAWNGTGTVFSAGTGTVNFGAAGTQTLSATATIFNNLTVSNAGLKTFSSTPTVNGILSMEGTATVSAAPTYGANATLQYNTATSRTAGVEWIMPFVASGGVIIANTGTITMNAAKVFNATAPLTVNSGATLSMSTFLLTLNGNFINNGGTASGTAGGVTITGTATQSIGAFTTTGTVSMSKTGGVATLTGNVNGGPLTINGSVGILNLGVGLTHTFTGDVSLTAGILNGGSSTLNANSSTATAWNGTGSVFTANAGTVNFGASGNQTIAANSVFYNLAFSGSGTKILTNVTTINNNFSVSGSAVVNLGNGAVDHTAKSLTLGGINQSSGTWGGTAATPNFVNDTYFLSTATRALNVDCAAPVAPTSGGDQTICSIQSIPTLSVTVAIGTADWYNQASGGTLLQANSLTYTPISAGTYYAETDNLGCLSPTRTAVILTINATPAVPVLTGSAICVSPGGNGTIKTATSENSVNYQLYDSSNTAVQASKPGTGTALTWTGISVANGYYVIATNPVGPCPSTSNSVNVTSTPNPIALSLTGTAICSSPGGDGSITSTTSVSGVSYQLYDGGNNPLQVAQAGTGAILTWSSLNAGTGYYVIGTNSVTGCISPTSNAVDITTTPNPVALVLTGSAICVSPGDNGIITSSTSVSGVDYQLFDNNDDEVGTPLSGTGSGLMWTGLLSGTGYYAVGTSATSCESPSSNTVDVTTTPNPTDKTVAVVSTSVCEGSGTNITVAASVNTVTYQLRNNSGNTNIGSPVTGSGGTINLPTGNLAVSTTFNVLATIISSGCTAQMTNTPTVTVNPLPTITGTTSVCVSSTTQLTGSGTAAASNAWVSAAPAVATVSNLGLVTGVTNGTSVITYTNNNGCQQTATVTVNTQPATPTITAGGTTTFCSGDSVLLSSSSITANQWYKDGSPISGATNQTYSATTSGSYTVIVTSSGCSSLASAATVVTVNPIPATPTITAGGTTTFCSGGSVLLSSSSIAGNQWYKDGSPISGETSQTYFATTSGSYTVIVTSGGCSSLASAATVITVNPNLTPTISIAANPSVAICAGSSVTFTATAGSTGGGTVNYDFKIGGSSVQSGATNTYTTTTLANGNEVTCEITVTAGTCLTATTATSNTITITVNSNLTPTVSIAANPSGAICAGSSVTFTATAGNTGGGTINYDFKVGGVSVQSSASDTYASTTLADGNVVTCDITVTAGACLTATTATSNTITITFHPPFTAGAIANTGETICSGNIPTLTIGSTTAASGGDNSIVYQWQYSTDSTFATGVTTISDSNYDPNSPPPPGRSGSVNGATYLPTQTLEQTTYYRRQAKDGSCNTAFTSSSEVWTVTVNIAPDLSNFSTDASDACLGFASQVIISSTTLADGIYNVTYVLSGANSGTQTQSVVLNGVSGTFNVVGLNISGNTTVTITNVESGGCSTVPTTGQSDVFVVNEVVTASVSISTDSDILCSSPSTKTFTATTINGGPFTLYQWKVNGGVVSTSISNVFTYSVEIGDKVVCDATSIKPCAIPKPATSNEITMVPDTVAPLISCPAAVTVSTDAGLCTASGVSLGNALTTDNCGVASLTNDAPAIFSIGITTVTWTVKDVNGLTATCTQDVTVTDNEKPLLTVPTTGLALGCNPTTLPTETSVASASTATDNCSATISVVAEAITGSCSKSQDFTVTATDGYGNTDDKIVTYTWTEDLVKPVIATTAVSEDKGCNPTIVAPVFTLTEACSPGTIVVVDSGVTGLGCAKSQTWTANFTDGCGNIADQVVVTYTWTEDIDKPIIATTAVSEDKGCNPMIVAPVFTLTEACSPGTIVVVDSGVTGLGCAKSQTWTANFTDGCGNIADAVVVTYTWTEDITKPIIATTAVSEDKGCNPLPAAIAAPVFTLTEACSPGSIVVVDSGVTGLGCAKSQTWTANFTDGCGNIADEVVVSYTWTEDITKPIIATIAVSEDKGCNPTIVAPVFTLTEACSSGSIVVVDSGVSGSGCAKTQTWTANFTDGCGNIADEVVVSYTWTEDITKPIIATIAVSEDKGCNPTIVAPVFTLTEACNSGSIVVVDSGVTGAGCAKSQTWTANFTDACLNVADEVVVTYTWTVDTTKPVIATTAVSGDKGCNPLPVAIAAPVFTLTEACSPGSIVVVDSGATGLGCAKSQTWTANFTDACLNIADAVVVTYTWTVDTTKPVIATTAVSGEKGCNPLPAAIAAPVFTLTEACSPGSIVVVDSGVTGLGCAKSQTWTANFTDACLNVADAVVVTYTWTEDLVKPVIATTAVSGDKGCNPLPAAIAVPVFTLTEACSPGSIVVVDSGVTGLGCAKSQTWTANFTDVCLNVADEVVVTYNWTEDLVKPVIATTAVSGDKGCNPTIVAPVFTLTEACNSGSIVVVDSGVTGLGCAKSQTWTANFTDACLNVADAVVVTYTWTEDITKPIIATTAVSEDKGCNPTIVAPVFTLTEACSPGTIVVVDSGVTGLGCAKSQTWTANFTDACLNVADAVVVTYTWTEDITKPIIATTAVSEDKGCNPTIVAPVFTLTEACSPGSIVVVDSGITGLGCAKSQTWTANFTDTCGNIADVVVVTYTWTEDLVKPIIATTAVSEDKGCNPTIAAPVFTLIEACSSGSIVVVDSGVTGLGCAKTQTWTANFTDACLNVADAVVVTYTWTEDLVKPVIATTAVSGDKGCNPLPAAIAAPVFTLTEACSPGSIVVVDSGVSGSGCAKSQTWTANFTDGCGNIADEVVVSYTWTVDATKPVIATTAVSEDKGCNPTIVAPVFTGLDNCDGVFTPVVTTAGATNNGCAYSQNWTATYTDTCGNIADQVVVTYTWTEDLVKPIITTTAVSEDKGCNPLPAAIAVPVFTLTEACSSGSIVVVDSGVIGAGCAKSQTWTANFTDACLNVADQVVVTYSWTEDLVKPIIATTAVSGDKGCNPLPVAIAAPVFTLTEACSLGSIVVVDSGATGLGCAKSQTWTANFTDACLNVADQVVVTYSWTEDITKPVIATTAVSEDKGCNPTIVAPVFTLTEACSPGSIVVVDSGVTGLGCAKSQTWTANFTDACLNVADAVVVTYTWTEDITKPIIATTAVSEDKGCNPTIVAPVFTLTEACSPGSIVVVDSGATGLGCAKSQTWTATYTDTCGNIADQVVVTYTWTEDTTKPVIATTAVSGDKGCNPTIVAPVFTLTEACSPGSIVVVDSGVSGSGCAKSQTWTANFTDGCGNIADQVVVTYTWTVDIDKPIIATTSVSEDKGCNPLPAAIAAPVFTLTEACSSGSIVVVDSGVTGLDCAKSQTWKANFTDTCGNKATEVVVTYTWTVDATKPVIATTAVSEDKGCNPTIVAPVFTGLDNCDGVFTPVVTTAGATNNECAYSQNWTATYTDTCGNIADQVVVTYSWTEDLVKPIITTTAVSEDKGCNPLPAAIAVPVFTLTEACSSGSIVVVDSGVIGAGCAKSQTWTANFTDACLNVADQVVVTYSWTEDLVKPIIATTAVSGDKGCNPLPVAIAAPVFTLTEACSLGSIVVVDSGATGLGCAKSQTWTANFTDACLNVADQVVVTYSWTEDITKPVIATTAVSEDKGCNPTIVAPVFTLTEACSPGSIVVVDSGVTGLGCAKSQTWTANFTDACLNVADAVVVTYTWTEDITKPIIATTAVSEDKGCNPTIVAPVFTLTEACSPGSIVVVDSGATGLGCAKSQTWTATYTDTCGNIADQVVVTYTWTEDTTKPVIATTAVSGDKGCNPTIVAPVFTLTEACSPGSIVVVDSGVTGLGCAKSQTWTANFTDACLNVADAVVVTYTWTEDITKPIIATTAVSEDKGCNPTIVAPVFTLTEACSPGSIVVVDSGATGLGCAKSQTWTATYTDTCGNIADQVVVTYTWTEDTTKPVIATTAVSGDKGCNPTIVAPVFTLTEACSPGSIVVVDSGVTGLGCAKSQTWTANFTDACLNVADAVVVTYTWTEDITKPIIATTAVSEDKGCNPTIVAPVFTLTEACSPGSIVVVDSGATGLGCAKSQTWTATYTDTCGNIADQVVVTYTWTEDTTKPVIATTAVSGDKGCNPTIVAPVFTLTEACSPGSIVVVDSGVSGSGCAKSQTWTANFTDGCGNIADQVVVTYTWTVDIDKPIIATTSVSEDKGCNPTIAAPVFTLTEACSPGSIVVVDSGVTGLGCAKSQTWTANFTDACLNVADAVVVTYTWTEDITKPIIATTAVSEDKGCNPTIVAPVFTLTEACSPGSIVVVDSGATGLGCAKSQTWTATYTDTCGNIADQVVVTYTWTEDTTKPVIATTAVSGDKGCNPTIVAPVFTLTEACSPGSIVVVDSGVTGLGCAKSQTWTANFTDACLNVADAVVVTYTWTEDITKPIIATTAVSEDKGCNPTIVAPVFTLTEACSPGSIVVVDSGATGLGCAKSQTWTATYTDTCGNIADQVVVTYTWTEDTTKPVIATTAVSGDKGCNPTIVAPVFTLTEACSPGSIVVVDSGVTGLGCAKSQTWTANFTDACLNVADAVVVTYTWTEDITKPIIATTAVSEDKGCNPTIVAPVFTLTEACSPGSIVVVDSGATGLGCAKSQTWTATYTDTCGNIADQVVVTYTWTEDTTKPVIATTAVSGDKGCNPTIVAPVFTLTEACSPGSIVVVDSGVSGSGCAKSQTWTANFTDGCGNIADQVVVTYTWTVDIDKPIIATTSVSEDKGCNPTIAAPVFTLTEACSPGSIVVVDSGVTGLGCAKSQTWTANFTDACLNVADAVVVTYTWTEDLVKPVIATTAVSEDKGCNPLPAAIAAPVFTLTEACSPGSIVVVDSGVTGLGCAKSQTWTANFTDACLNVADAVVVTYTWTEDIDKPIIATTAVSEDKGCNPTIVAPVFTLTEACSPGTIVVVDSGVTGLGCAKSQTWTANFTDACLNVADAVVVTYTWTEDITKPVIATTAVSEDKGCNPLPAAIAAPVFTLTEACSPGSIVVVDSGVSGLGCAKTQTWTANFTDACLNVADQVVVTYTWTEDLVKPVIATTAVSEDKGCNPLPAAIAAPVFTLTEACSPGTIVVVDSGVTGLGCAKSQTWTANFTDGCGNIADEVVVTYTWTEDIDKPIIATTAVSGDKGCNPLPAAIAAPVFTLTEACSSGTIVVVDSGVTGLGCAKSQTWTANFTDGCGNIADEVVVSYTWTEDITKPIIATTAVSEDKGCNPTIAAPVFTLTEACSSGSIVVVDSAVSGSGCAKSQTWTANFTDACLNVADEVVVTYNWTEDLVKPVIATTAVSGDKGCNPLPVAIAAPVFTLTEVCSPGGIVVVDSGATGLGCAKSQTWTANFTDACLNIADAVVVTYTWTVDTTKPVIATTAVSGDKGCNPLPAAIAAPVFTLTEACSPGSIVVVDSGVTGLGCAKSQTWTANFTDACLNVADAVVVTYTWTEDITKPVIATTAVSEDKGCNPLPAAIAVPVFTLTEACSPGSIVVVDSGVSGLGCAKTQTWTANFTDACLNVADQVVVTYTWTEDLVKPVIATTAVSGDKGCNPLPVAIAAPVFTLTEACSPGSIVVVDSGVTGLGCAKSQTWTANFTDGCGNIADEVVVTYTWTEDIELPIISLSTPGTLGYNPDAVTIVAAFGSATVTDNCSTGLVATGTVEAETGTDCYYSTTKNWTVTDTCGNTATASQTLTYIRDLDKPLIICPAALVVGTNTACTYVGTIGTATATDNCSTSLDLIITNDAPAVFPLGTTTVTWTATDAAGNTQSCTQIISVFGAADAVDDVAGPINGTNGGDAGINVLNNDILNCSAMIPPQVTITSTPTTELKVNTDGTVNVTPGTPAGIYKINYQICDILNPANCDTATVTVTVVVTTIDAVNDVSTTVNGKTGGTTPSVLANDNLNGLSFLPADVILTWLPLASGLTLNPDGTIIVAAGTAVGTYPVTYSICQVDNPTICDTATTSVIVTTIDAVVYQLEPTINTTGGTVLSVLDNDTINGLPFLPADVILTSLPLASGLTLNSDGTITVAPGTQAGIYPVTYTICQVANPTICDTASTNIIVIETSVLPPSPSMSLTKEGTYVDSNGDGKTNLGDTVFYNFVVTNTGNVALSNIIITDTNAIVTGGPIDILAVGASNATTFTAIHSITQLDIDTGQVDNLALGSGNALASVTITATSTDPTPCLTCTPIDPSCSSCTIVKLSSSPSISLIAKAEFNDSNGDGIAQVGEIISYTFIVTNTGNVTLSDITVTDQLLGLVITGGPITLVPRQSDTITFIGTYVLTLQDLLNGKVINQSIVSAKDPQGNTISDLSDDDDGLGDDPTVVEINGCEINVFNAISSNESPGVNDALIIGGIECYPNNTVEIYNRWGVLVYETKGYDNVTNVFNGISNGRGSSNKNSNLTDGTYFYILTYSNSNNEKFQKSGYLYLMN